MLNRKVSVDDTIERASRGNLSRRRFGELRSMTGVSLMTVPIFMAPP